MNKIFKILGLFLALLACISCANTIGPDSSLTPELDSILSPDKDGIHLVREDVPNSTTLKIKRTNISKGETAPSGEIFIRLLTDKPIVDYYVNPGDVYKYELTYIDINNNWNELKTVTTGNIKASGGLGELEIDKQPKTSFDYDTATLKFIEKPSLPNKFERFILNSNNSSIDYKLYYKHGDKKGHVMFLYVEDSIDCCDKLVGYMGSSCDDYFEKPLSLDYLQIQVWQDGVSYSKNFSASNAPAFPQSITVKDTRIPLVVEPTIDGNKVKITKKDNDPNIKQYKLNKYDEKSNLIGYYVIKNIDTLEIIDPYVDKNIKYSYCLDYINENGSEIDSSKTVKVTAVGGKGEVNLQGMNCVFNNNTGIMTVPNLDELLNNYNISGELSKKLIYYYGISYADGFIIHDYLDKDKKEIDWVKAVTQRISHTDDSFKESVYKNGIELYNSRLEINTNDDIEYTFIIPKDKLLNSNCKIIDPLIIPDTRVKTVVTQDEKGAKISFTPIPKDCKSLRVSRKDVETGKTEEKYISLISPKEDDVIVDYFAVPGRKYQYKISYYNQGDWDCIKETNFSDDFTSNVGIKDINDSLFDTTTTTTVTYDQTSGVMTISPKPDFSKILKELNTVAPNNTSFKVCFTYAREDNRYNYLWGNVETGIINWQEILAEDYFHDMNFGQQLVFKNVQINTKVNNLEFETYLSREAILQKINNFPEKITVNKPIN